MQYRPSRFSIMPPVVKNILIINALVFFACIVLGRSGIDLSEWLALYHWDSPKFKIWQFVTHMFMHGNVGGAFPNYEAGFMHLFSNMFALWMFGALLENYFGSKRFLTFYMLCGIGAAAIHLGVYSYELLEVKQATAFLLKNLSLEELNQYILTHKVSSRTQFGSYLIDVSRQWENHGGVSSFAESARSMLTEYSNYFINQGTVGASGAVFGILFAFGYLFPNTMIYLYFFFPMKAKYFVALYALFELYAGIRNSAGDNVAHFAHLGGMVIAFIVIKIWNKQNKTDFY